MSVYSSLRYFLYDNRNNAKFQFTKEWDSPTQEDMKMVRGRNGGQEVGGGFGQRGKGGDLCTNSSFQAIKDIKQC